MQQRSTFNKREKLKSRKRIELLFKQGKSFSVFPYRVYFLVRPLEETSAARDSARGSGNGQTGDAGANGGVEGAVEGMALATGVAVGGGVDAAEVTGMSDALESGALADEIAAGASGAAGEKLAAGVVQAGFGAGSRYFKKAVDRNRIKRLGREAYRLQKAPLVRQLTEKQLRMDVFFIYTGKELPAYQLVSEKIAVALQKLLKETA